MIQKLIYAILNLLVKVTSILLLPLDTLITNLLPDFGNTLEKITEYMSLPFQFMGWVFELVHIPSFCLTLLVSAFVYKYAIIGVSSGVKYIITLYQRFKP